jgi:hypothetical protein
MSIIADFITYGINYKLPNEITDLIILLACEKELMAIYDYLIFCMTNNSLKEIEVNKEQMELYKKNKATEFDVFVCPEKLEFIDEDRRIEMTNDNKLNKKIDKILALNSKTKLFPINIKTMNSIDNTQLFGLENICNNLTIYNKDGYNDDPRSTGDHHITINDIGDYQYVINGMTPKNILIGIMMTKSSKTDFWYELYCGGKLKRTENTNSYIYSLSFDHGS